MVRLLGLLVYAVSAQAAADTGAFTDAKCPLRIVHTNDLHSHLDHGNDPNIGGYARVKAMLDRLKEDSRARGIPQLTLDAGDFLEGSEFYFAEQGKRVFETMDHMGYDAVTIGNHDWLMGAEHLDQVVGSVQPHFQFLGANFRVNADQRNLTRWMRPSAEFVRGATRIAVLGLTTHEFFYRWRVGAGHIADPIKEAKADIPALRKRNDFVIALSHLGLGADVKLVKKVPGIDLVVGGHSHTLLGSPQVQSDPDGRYVPIVQAGAHGEWVGDLLLDACPGIPLRVVRYELHQVTHEDPEDADIAAEVEQTRHVLEKQFGGADWWNEVVGVSDVPLSSLSYHVSEWSDAVADAFRELGGADVAIDLGVFGGISQPSGPIRRSQIAALYPHVFEFDGHPQGWTVWTAKVPGVFLKFIVEYMLQGNWAFSVSGMTIDAVQEPGAPHPKLKRILINGRPLHLLKSYSVALPETLVRGPREISSIFRDVIRHPHDTAVPVWAAIERHLRLAGTIEPMKPENSRVRIR